MCENKIIIMCGGKGKRLGNLTESIPKTLIKIGEKTILEMKFDNYMNQGFKDFILCIGYKGNLIEKAVEEFKFPFNCKLLSLTSIQLPSRKPITGCVLN